LENAEDAANVFDATFQQAKDVDYSPEYFAQNHQNGNPRLENSNSEQNTTGEVTHGVSHGSSVSNQGYEARESFLHSSMGHKIEAQILSDRAVNLFLRLDKANSPCVGIESNQTLRNNYETSLNSPSVTLKAIELYTITKMKVRDTTLFTSQFVREYLENEAVKVRLLAVRTCARLMGTAAHSWIEI